MTTFKCRWLAMPLFIVLFTIGCSDDTDPLSFTQDPETADERRRRGGPNGGGGDPSGNNAAELPGTLATDWMKLFLELDQYATGMRPNACARAIAYINLAAYETALPSMRDFVSNESRLQGLRIERNINRRDLDVQLALNAGYADVIDHFVLNIPQEYRNKIEALEAQNFQSYSAGVPSRTVEESLDWGEYIARQVIRYATSDREAEKQILEPQPNSYEPPSGEGYWTYSADAERGLFPYWESVRTFVISPEQSSSIPPMPYSENPSSPYYHQMEEVFEVSTTAAAQDNEQLWIAEFWSDDVEGLMISPPGRQVSIATQLIEQQDMNLQDALYLLLKLGFSLNDAAVSTWQDKYEYMVMRPSVFIHEFIDPDFQTNLYRFINWPNPTFPGYPSGHSCFASAAAGVFIDFFGDNTRFTDLTHEGQTAFRGTPRTFNTLSEMAEENAFSRIPLGVHIRMDCTEGLRLGYEISDAVNDYDLIRPNT